MYTNVSAGLSTHLILNLATADAIKYVTLSKVPDMWKTAPREATRARSDAPGGSKTLSSTRAYTRRPTGQDQSGPAREPPAAPLHGSGSPAHARVWRSQRAAAGPKTQANKRTPVREVFKCHGDGAHTRHGSDITRAPTQHERGDDDPQPPRHAYPWASAHANGRARCLRFPLASCARAAHEEAGDVEYER
eukprot:7385985-Prymnesium_polylepis.1